MGKRFRPYHPEQTYLLPPSLRDWLAEDHLAYFLGDLVDELDLSELYSSYRPAGSPGQPAFHPRMMTKLLLYAYCVGVGSSRRIEERTHTDVAFRVLAAGEHPDHDTICEFRSRHLESLSRLFVQVLLVCRQAGLVKLGHVALDSTKVKANASKHKAMSYARMGEVQEALEAQVRELLEEARQADEEEDRRYGKGKRGDELPEELRLRRSRLEKIREAKEALEQEAAERSEPAVQQEQESEPVARGRRKPKGAPGVPKPTAQRNFTDPESRIMKDTGTQGFVQGYSAQAAVDSTAQVIVAAEVVNEGNDKAQVEPALHQIEKNLGELPKELSADAGYYGEANVLVLQQSGVEGFIPPGKQRHGSKALAAPRGRIPKEHSVKDRMLRKLRTKRGRQKYSKRKGVVEPVFGQIKAARGFRQFLLRGQQKVRAEWRLICLTHNILKLWRSGYPISAG